MATAANFHAVSGLAPGTSKPLFALADRCVQCGLCLPHCPTYALDRNEAESPRGRIALARALAEGSLIPTALADAHLDHCLGCRRCEPVCPAGVEYGALLLEYRHEQRTRRDTGWRQKTIEWLTARPRMLDRLLGLYRQLYFLLPKLLPRPPRRIAIHTPLRGPIEQPAEHMTAALFRGCVGRRYDAATHAALKRLCAATGIALLAPDTQTCCGAVHAHAGNADAAAALASRNRAAFAAGVPVLGTATGCQASLADSLAGHAPVMDAAQFLLAHAAGMRFRPADRCVALHLPCTQRQTGSVSGHHVVRSDDALRALLAMIPGLHVIELPDSGCCGAAGTYMLDFPERARALRQPVLDAFQASGAELLLSANVGCRLHLQNGIDRGDIHNAGTITVRHPLDFLADFLLAVPE